jgi:hypothetical protein
MASPTHAGSYSDPVFSGGYYTFDGDPTFYYFPDTNPYEGDHEGASFAGGDPTANLTATATWTPAYTGEVAPQVIVTEIVSAYWHAFGVNSEPTAT